MLGLLATLIGDLVGTGVGFVEAEGRQLRAGAMKFAVACALLVVSLLLMVAMVTFLAIGVYVVLQPPLGSPAAAFLTAGAALFLALFVGLLAKAYVA